MSEIFLPHHLFLVVVLEPPHGPKMTQRRYVTAEVMNFRVGLRYFVGRQAVDKSGKPYTSMFETPVTTRIFTVTIYHEAVVLFAATSLEAPQVFLPISLVEIGRRSDNFSDEGATLVNRA